MFLKLTNNRVIDITGASLNRGAKGEVIISQSNGERTETFLSFDDLLVELEANNQLLDLSVVQITEDQDNSIEDDDSAIFGHKTESSNLSSDGDDSETTTHEEPMKSEYAREMQSSNNHARQTEADHLAASSKVYGILRKLYPTVTSFAPNMKLVHVTGYDKDEFVNTLDNDTDFTYEIDTFNDDTTIGDVINLLERKQIEVNTQKVQEEHPIDLDAEQPKVVGEGAGVISQSATTQTLAGPDETTGKLPEEIGAGSNVKPSETMPENSESSTSESDDEVEAEDDAEEDSHKPVTVDQVHAAIYSLLDIDSGDSDINPNIAIEELLADNAAATKEDIVDHVSDKFEVEIDDEEVFSTTTITQLTDLINSRRIAV